MAYLASAHAPANVAFAAVALVFFGFTLIAIGGTLGWLIPGATAPSRSAALATLGLAVAASVYWSLAIPLRLFDILSGDFILVFGVPLAFLANFSYFAVGLIRSRRKG